MASVAASKLSSDIKQEDKQICIEKCNETNEQSPKPIAWAEQYAQALTNHLPRKLMRKPFVAKAAQANTHTAQAWGKHPRKLMRNHVCASAAQAYSYCVKPGVGFWAPLIWYGVKPYFQGLKP